MFVSVIIPLYNKEKYIRRAVESVLNQTMQDFELIVVNDGSTDNSASAVRDYCDPRIHLVDQENQGVSAARNRGIEEAQGELIAFLDADDEWSPDFLSTIMTLTLRFPDAGAYFTGWRLLKSEKNIYRVRRIKNREDTCGCYFDLLDRGGVVNASSIAVRRCVFDTLGGFRTGYRRGEDVDLWFRIGLHFQFACSPKMCSQYYYYLPDNSSHITPPDKTSAILLSLTECEEESSISLSVKRKARKYAAWYLAKEAERMLVTGMVGIGRTRADLHYRHFGLTTYYCRLLVLSILPPALVRLLMCIRLEATKQLLACRGKRSDIQPVK